MQLDRCRIVVRERDFTQLLDLALRVARMHLGPLALAWACGVLPATALWTVLIGLWTGMFTVGNTIAPTNLEVLARWLESPEGAFAPGYVFFLAVAVYWTAPLASSPLTLVLGRLLFEDRPSLRAAAGQWLDSLPQLLVETVVRRGLWMLTVVGAVVPAAMRAYAAEVILLERNPWRSVRGRISTPQRIGGLHGYWFGTLFARWLASVAAAFVLTISFWLSLRVVCQVLFGPGELFWDFLVFYPLSLALTTGYFTVVRFLSYLDLRIRREGWEVELLLRAEGDRIARRMSY